jgi:hypothetical protein
MSAAVFAEKAARTAADRIDRPAVSAMRDAQIKGDRRLPKPVRAFLEPRLAWSFGDVRVHTGGNAAAAASRMRARAYAVGDDVVLGEKEYAPATLEGTRVLAHELVHVAQQQRGAVPRSVQRLAIEDCSAEHTPEVRDAAAAVTPAVRRTINRILENPRAPDAEAALAKYFGASGPSNAVFVAHRLALTSAGLARDTVECENPGSFMYGTFCPPDTYAYVRAAPAFFHLGNIHLCQPQFHGLTPLQRMATLVHESAHNNADASNDNYYTLDCEETAETRAMSDSDRRWNADSYACLVQTLG